MVSTYNNTITQYPFFCVPPIQWVSGDLSPELKRHTVHCVGVKSCDFFQVCVVLSSHPVLCSNVFRGRSGIYELICSDSSFVKWEFVK
jgi:hypothetical protein